MPDIHDRITVFKQPKEDKDINDLTAKLHLMKTTDLHGDKETSPKHLIYKKSKALQYVINFHQLNATHLFQLLLIFNIQFKTDCVSLVSTKDAIKMIKEKFVPKFRDTFVCEMDKQGIEFTRDISIWYKVYRLLQFTTTHIYPKLTPNPSDANYAKLIKNLKFHDKILYFDTVQFCWDYNFSMIGKPQSFKSKKFMYMALSIDFNMKPKATFLDEDSVDEIVERIERKCMDSEVFRKVKYLLHNYESYAWILVEKLLDVKHDITIATSNSEIDTTLVSRVLKAVYLIDKSNKINIKLMQLSKGFVSMDPIFYWTRYVMNHHTRKTLNFNDRQDMIYKMENVSVTSFIQKSMLLKYDLFKPDLLGLFHDVCGNKLDFRK